MCYSQTLSHITHVCCSLSPNWEITGLRWWFVAPLPAPGPPYSGTRMWPTIKFRFSAGLILSFPHLPYATAQLHILGSGLKPSCQYQNRTRCSDFFVHEAAFSSLSVREGDIEDVCQAAVSWRGQCTSDSPRPSIFPLATLPSLQSFMRLALGKTNWITSIGCF